MRRDQGTCHSRGCDECRARQRVGAFRCGGPTCRYHVHLTCTGCVMTPTFVIAVAVALATVAGSIFTGLSLRYLARQTTAQTKQTELLFAATELSFNLEVMMRLDDTLAHVAQDE